MDYLIGYCFRFPRFTELVFRIPPPAQARTGTALAIDMALWSAVRMAAPGMGASLLSSAGGAGTVGAASAALVAALMGAMHLGVVEY